LFLSKVKSFYGKLIYKWHFWKK